MIKTILTKTIDLRLQILVMVQAVLPVAVVVASGVAFYDFIVMAVLGNPVLNMGILAVGVLGTGLILGRLFEAQREHRACLRFAREVQGGAKMGVLVDEKWLSKRMMRRFLDHIALTNGKLSSQLDQDAIEAELHAINGEFDSKMELPNYLVGFMIAMGLLGTFIGLLETLTGTAGGDIIYADGFKQLTNGGNTAVAHAALDAETGQAPTGTAFYYAKEVMLNVAGYIRRLDSITVSGLPDGISVEGGTSLGGGGWSIPTTSVVPTAKGLTLVYDVTKMRAQFATGATSTDLEMTVTIVGQGVEAINISKRFLLRFQDVTAEADITANSPVYLTGAGGGWTDIYVMPTASTPHLINAGEGNNTVYGGNSGDDVIRSYGGNMGDFIYGSTANNVLDGGLGDDTLFGHAGDDFLYAGPGRDYIDGGAGTDTLWFYGFDDGAGHGVRVDLSNNNGETVLGATGWSTITINDGGSTRIGIGRNFENIQGSAHADNLTGTSAANTLYGGDGNDTLYGLAGNDTLYGGTGSDTLYGGGNTDVLYGDADSDTFGLTAALVPNQTIHGGSGNASTNAATENGTDTLLLTDNWTMSNLNIGLLHSIEAIDLRNGGASIDINLFGTQASQSTARTVINGILDSASNTSLHLYLDNGDRFNTANSATGAGMATNTNAQATYTYGGSNVVVHWGSG
jgi:Ca2+-binding RTX toxin-like protein